MTNAFLSCTLAPILRQFIFILNDKPFLNLIKLRRLKVKTVVNCLQFRYYHQQLIKSLKMCDTMAMKCRLRTIKEPPEGGWGISSPYYLSPKLQFYCY